MKLKNLTLIGVTVIAFGFTPDLGHAQTAKKEKAEEVGGAAMYPAKILLKMLSTQKILLHW